MLQTPLGSLFGLGVPERLAHDGGCTGGLRRIEGS